MRPQCGWKQWNEIMNTVCIPHTNTDQNVPQWKKQHLTFWFWSTFGLFSFDVRIQDMGVPYRPFMYILFVQFDIGHEIISL